MSVLIPCIIAGGAGTRLWPVSREAMPKPFMRLPDGMTSGLYKYIVFEELEKSTGKVYDQPCHRIMGRHDELPNTDWVAENHWCVPLYYRPESREAALSTKGES